MSLRFSCPCGQKLKTPDDSAGKRAQCSQCKRWLKVPQSSSYETVAQELPAPAKASASKSHGQGGGPKSRAPAPTAPKAPAADAKPAPAPSVQPTPPPPTDAAPAFIVADGDASALQQTADLLRQYGYDVLRLTDGGAVMETARARKPCAMILDVRLETISGFQVVQQLRNVSNSANKDVWEVPVLMTTTKLRGRDKQYALSIGINDYEEKPLTQAQVSAWLDRSVKTRPGLA